MNYTQPKYHTHITSDHKFFKLNLKEVWRYRDLIWLFTKRTFVVSYKQTILGPAWLFITPIISSLIYCFIFGGIAGMGTDGVPQMLFYLSGNAIWAFFSTCLTNNASTFTAYFKCSIISHPVWNTNDNCSLFFGVLCHHRTGKP